MAWLRARVLPITGVLCLVGQGTLLFLAGTRSNAPELPLPTVFLLLTISLAVVLALSRGFKPGPADPTSHPPSLLWRLFLLAAMGCQLAVSLGFFLVNGAGSRSDWTDRPQEIQNRLEQAEEILVTMQAELQVLGEQAAGYFPNEDPFQSAEAIAQRWVLVGGTATGGLPLEVVVWRDQERMAWTDGAEPLPGQGSTPELTGAGALASGWQRGRRSWVLQQWVPVPDGRLELQIPLAADALAASLPGIRLSVPGRDGAGNAFQPERGLPPPDGARAATGPGREVQLGQPDSGPVIRLDYVDPGVSDFQARMRSRLFLAALSAWVLTLAGILRLFFGVVPALVGLWIGRCLLALVDFFRWIGPAFPDQSFPAGPSSGFSLVDPAYFATPFAAGWFASVADALLSACLVAVTARHLLVRLGLAGSDESQSQRLQNRSGPGPGPVSGLVFGSIMGLLLMALRLLAGILAENANARLIGTGVPLSSLSFWGLQVVLMLSAFSLTCVVVGVVARRWSDATEVPAWLAGGLAASLGAWLGTLVSTEIGWGFRLEAGAIVLGLWLLAPGLRVRPMFMRRLVWPGVLLLTVVWNYSSLRQVYDGAERGWLQRKAVLITESDEDWTRFLLGGILEDMVLQDRRQGEGAARTDIWRDESAWLLWQDSALRDLDYSCQVELLDPDGDEESFIALGFMRDFQYEVVDRREWVAEDGSPPTDDWYTIFQTERRVYAGGEEVIMAGEIAREQDAGWIRVEIPVRSWRIRTLKALMTAGDVPERGQYQPRAEVDRPFLLLRGDDTGWLDAGDAAFPPISSEPLLQKLKSGQSDWAVVPIGDHQWHCLWKPLPVDEARSSGEGFLLGLRRSGLAEDLLDMSRLMLLNLVLLSLLMAVVHVPGYLQQITETGRARQIRRPGFQERFLAGYLLLGLILLLVVGMSVDRVGYERVRSEAGDRTRSGISLAVEQLRSLIVEQARTLAGSEYIADLLVGQLAGQRPAGPLEFQQAMVFGADGRLLLDETLSDLSNDEGRSLLAAGRLAPLVIIVENEEIFVGAVIPIELGDIFAASASDTVQTGHAEDRAGGFFFYRQRLNVGLLGGLADLVRGQATLMVDGRPILASHPAGIFSGQTPLLADPSLMAAHLAFPNSPGVFSAPDRPFAFTGGQPLPAFGRDQEGRFRRGQLPAILALAFPDREREYITQRKQTVLFLAGLANLILLTALLLALVMSWSIFRPLRLLSAATRSLARGDFQAPLPDAGRDEVGRLAGAFRLMRNDLHIARESLAYRERFLTTVLDTVPVGVAVLDQQDDLVTLNPAGQAILADFHPGLSEIQGVRHLQEAFAALVAGETGAGELSSADRRRNLRGALAPLDLPDGRTYTMLVFEDITEFLQNKKMALNAELARQVAHEIKNPLTPIQLSVQLLGQAWQDGHEDLERLVPQTVERVLDQVTLLRSIASEFSLLGRPDQLETAPVDLQTLVLEVTVGYGAVTTGAATDRNEIRVPRVNIEPGVVPQVLAHRESLQKILGNLMQNSLDAVPAGETPEIQVSWVWSDQQVTLIWKDNGEGLSGDVAEHLFDPYFSTKSKGTGLGLAICRSLVDRMGGNITLANRVDHRGAMAELTLLRADAIAGKEQT